MYKHPYIKISIIIAFVGALSLTLIFAKAQTIKADVELRKTLLSNSISQNSQKNLLENNSIAATNYYPPLDSLHPEITYALSFIAMTLGISGAIIILKKNPEKKVSWVANMQQEPLI